MNGADVRSIPALRDWLAALAVYQADLGDALAGVSLEIRRAHDWVSEQSDLWQRAVRECDQEVVQAKAELAARRFPGFDGRMPDTTVQERNLRRAEGRHEHAENKVRACRAWLGKLPKLVEEIYTGRGHKLRLFLETDVARALATLSNQVESLERYAELKADFSPGAASPPPPPA